MPWIVHLLQLVRLLIEDRQRLALENVALRHQLAVLKRSVARPKIHDSDGAFRILARYTTSRPHQSLDRNSSVPCKVEAVGDLCATPVLGGPHNRHFRAA